MSFPAPSADALTITLAALPVGDRIASLLRMRYGHFPLFDDWGARYADLRER